MTRLQLNLNYLRVLLVYSWGTQCHDLHDFFGSYTQLHFLTQISCWTGKQVEKMMNNWFYFLYLEINSHKIICMTGPLFKVWFKRKQETTLTPTKILEKLFFEELGMREFCWQFFKPMTLYWNLFHHLPIVGKQMSLWLVTYVGTRG